MELANNKKHSISDEEKTLDDDIAEEEFKFVDSDVATVIRRTHTRPESLNQNLITNNNVVQDSKPSTIDYNNSEMNLPEKDYEILDDRRCANSPYYKADYEKPEHIDNYSKPNKLENLQVQSDKCQTVTNKDEKTQRVAKTPEDKNDRSDNNSLGAESNNCLFMHKFEKCISKTESTSIIKNEPSETLDVEVPVKASMICNDSPDKPKTTWEEEKLKADKLAKAAQVDSIKNDLISNDVKSTTTPIDHVEVQGQNLNKNNISINEQGHQSNVSFNKSFDKLYQIPPFTKGPAGQTTINSSNNLDNSPSSM